MKLSAAMSMGLLTCTLVSVSQISYADVMQTVAPALSELSAEDQERVKNGTPVAIFDDVAGAPWPKARFYYYVKATAEEGAAAFFDYARHCNFFPDCKESSLVKQMDRFTSEVKYTIKLPWVPWPFNSETYTVFDKLNTYDIEAGADTPNGKSYSITWNLKEETSKTKEIQGSIRFEPCGKGHILSYTNFTRPNSSLAGTFVGTAKEKMQAVVVASVQQIEKEAMSDRPLLDGQIMRLRKVLQSRAMSVEGLGTLAEGEEPAVETPSLEEVAAEAILEAAPLESITDAMN